MFNYAMLGTNDLPRAIKFYDAVMGLLGHERCFTEDHCAAWGTYGGDKAVRLYVGQPFDEQPATVSNGGMLALRTRSPDLVEKAFETALALGGKDEGAPGPRPQYGPGFYAAYVRDPDGNKLGFINYGPEASK
ncbi:VOC family protein [Lacibacterium aquatile]|uniref:VOC family protein n=1 Tax=Lacibacterium aquatile TaxID=1168082 RepID=A0ABW5DP76_9PROT